jgi:hypothetical protein
LWGDVGFGALEGRNRRGALLAEEIKSSVDSRLLFGVMCLFFLKSKNGPEANRESL